MDPIRVKGVEVSPFDVLMALVKRPVNTFLEEDEESAGAPLKVVAGTTIEVSGWEGEDKVEYDLFFPTFLYLTPEERLEIYRKFGASNIYVAAPAVVGAKMCVQGKADRGVIAAECLEPLEFLKEMTEIGAPVRFREVHVRQVEIA
jgi:saccharopine dehydrogenase-like NADP-dependent oxidoreductase